MPETAILTWSSAGTRARLFESITSFLENAVSHGHESEIYLATNNTSQKTLDDVENKLAETTADFASDAFVSSVRDRDRAIAELGSDFDPDVVRAALVPEGDLDRFVGPGANQNAMILAHAGRRFVSTDDDVHATTAQLSAPDLTGDPDFKRAATDLERYDWTDAFLPVHIRYRVSREQARSTVTLTDRDILDEHDRVLGSSVTVIHDDDSRRSGTVRVSTPGAYGDSGMGAARTILGIDGVSRSVNFSADDSYKRIRYARDIIRIAERPYVGPGAHLMGMHIGLDNTQLLPPMVPFGRNADGLFGVTTRIMDLTSVTAFFDFGVFHDAEERGPFSRGDLTSLYATAPDVIMAVLVHNLPPKELSDPADRLRHLGTVLLELASLPTSEFQTEVHSIWSRGFYNYAERLEGLLDTYERQPPTWADDVTEHLDTVYERLREPNSIFPERRGVGSAERSKKLVGIYGAVLEIWPDLWGHCAERNRRGDPSILTHQV